MEGCRQERRGIEGKGYGGAEGTGIAENLPMGHSCRGPQGPSKPGKNARSTEENRVRSRQVTPSRKTAFMRALPLPPSIAALVMGVLSSNPPDLGDSIRNFRVPLLRRRRRGRRAGLGGRDVRSDR